MVINILQNNVTLIQWPTDVLLSYYLSHLVYFSLAELIINQDILLVLFDFTTYQPFYGI